MPKKKVNVRKDYSYAAKKGPPKYKAAAIARKPNLLILRGPGLNPAQVIEENRELRASADKKHLKLKFLQANTEEALIAALKDSVSWASGMIVHLGTHQDESGKLRTIMKKLACPAIEVGSDGSFENAIKKLITATALKE